MMELISILIVWATLIGGVWILFNAMEKTAKSVAKRKASKWIKGMVKKSIKETILESPRWFIKVFDRIFGEKHLTKKCFFRSSVASMITVFFMIVMWYVLDPASWTRCFLQYPITAPILFSMVLRDYPAIYSEAAFTK